MQRLTTLHGVGGWLPFGLPPRLTALKYTAGPVAGGDDAFDYRSATAAADVLQSLTQLPTLNVRRCFHFPPTLRPRLLVTVLVWDHKQHLAVCVTCALGFVVNQTDRRSVAPSIQFADAHFALLTTHLIICRVCQLQSPKCPMQWQAPALHGPIASVPSPACACIPMTPLCLHLCRWSPSHAAAGRTYFGG